MRDLRHESAVAFPDLVDWIDFLGVEGKAELTLYNYTREVALLLREYPETPFAEFTPEQINRALAKKPQRSRYITRSIFNGWFEWGELQERIDRTPMRKVAKPKHPKRRPKELFDEAEIALLEGLPVRDGALLSIMFTCGPRKAGCRRLQRKHIDLDRRRIVLHEKGDKVRVVPFPLSMQKIIADLDLVEGLNPDDYLWYSRPGGGRRLDRSHPIGDTTFDHWWQRVTAEAGVRYLNIHQTRHTYQRRCQERRIPIEIRRFVMGHEKIATTEDQYGSTSIDDAQAVLDEVWT